MYLAEVTALRARMEKIYNETAAQADHYRPLHNSGKAWSDMEGGLQQTVGALAGHAQQMEPAWQDAAGDLYLQRVRQGAAKVDGWHQTMKAANVPAALAELRTAIGTTINHVTELKRAFDAAADRFELLMARFNEAGAGSAALVAAIEAAAQEMVRCINEGQAALDQLSQRFVDAAEVMRSAANGEPAQNAQGPATTLTAPSAAPTSTGASTGAGSSGPGPAAAGPVAAPAGASPGAVAGGASATGASPGGPAGGAGAPAVPAPAGLDAAGTGGPSLSGLGVPSLSLPSGTGLPTPTIPSPTPITPGTTVPPFIPPVSNFAGSGKAFSTGGPISTPSPRIAGGLTPAGLGTTGVAGVPGTVAGAGGGRIPRAANPGTATTTPTSGQAASVPAGPGGDGPAPAGTRGTPPPMMPPMAGARGGAGGGKPKPGNADGDGTKHKARPPRTVPGVPARLRGRAGKLDATPAFLSPARRSPQESEETEDRRTQLLDEELWQVGGAPGAEVTNRRQSRG